MKKSLFIALLTCISFALGAEETLIMIKPEQVQKGNIGAILQRLETAHLKVVALKMTKLSGLKAASFYDSLKAKSFFPDLVKYMSSGPIVTAVLQSDHAVNEARAVIGSTNPEEATAGTIRKDFGTNIQENAIHGSDSPESAKREIAFFFTSGEIFN